MISDSSPGALLVIAAMALVTVALRWLGYYLMGHVRLGPRLEAGFRTLPGAVAAALFAPFVLADGVTAFAAILVAVILARLGRSDTVAMVIAIPVAVLLRKAGL